MSRLESEGNDRSVEMSYHIPVLDSEAEFCLKENLFCGSAMAAETRVPPTLAVVDVYETASLIGNEFETLIEKYGTESITTLMPMIIRVLEHLEFFASNAEKGTEELEELKFEIKKLRSKEEEKAVEKQRLDKELESIEEQWKCETQDLISMISKLTEENNKLKARVKKEAQDCRDIVASEHESNLAEKMRGTIEQQRSQIRSVEQDNLQKSQEIEATQSQVERLTKVNADLRRKSALNTRQTHKLMEEKAELEAKHRDMEQQLLLVKDQLRIHEANSSQDFEPTSSDFDLTNKLIIDLKDPNRPRFTLNELREVLFERNELKTKLLETEEELSRFKPRSQPDEEYDDDDAPVQGPMPKEPDEKLNPWAKKEESGIRKLFGFLKKRHNMDN